MAIAVDRARGTGRVARRAARVRRRRRTCRPRHLQVRELLRRQRQRAAGASLGVRPLAVPHVLLPIGISFFTFHAISYVIDVYRRDATAQKSPVHAALYLLLFPQLIAGPIIRYRDIADQLARAASSRSTTSRTASAASSSASRKKVLIANVVAGPADRIFAMPFAAADRRRTPGSASSATRCRSTSTSPATPTWRSASGAMFGFRFPENFRWPYIADTRPGLLAPLAHLAVDLVPRLPLRAARRQPRRRRRGRTSISSRSSSCAASGTARAGTSSSGASGTARSSSIERATRRVTQPLPRSRRAPVTPLPRCPWPFCPSRLHAARRDDRLGVLPRRHAAPARWRS